MQAAYLTNYQKNIIFCTTITTVLFALPKLGSIVRSLVDYLTIYHTIRKDRVDSHYGGVALLPCIYSRSE